MIAPKEKTLYGLLIPTLFSSGLFILTTPVSSMEALAELMKGSDMDSFSISDVLTEEVKNTKDKLVMDKQSETKLYQRGFGDEKSIVSFSFSTTILPPKTKSNPFNPVLEQYDTSKYIMDNLIYEFKGSLLPAELAIPCRKTRIDHHASEYFDEDSQTNDKEIKKTTKRYLNSVYSGQEILDMGSYKKRKMDTEFTLSEALYEAIHHKDYDITIVFSYQDGTREFKLNLKTDNSPDTVTKIPSNAEKIPQEPDLFFSKLREWLEATLSTKSKILGGKIHGNNKNNTNYT